MANFVPTKVIVHHSLTKDSGTVSWGAIRKYHTKVLGWKDIGYHACVELVESGDGLYHEALLGRMWDIPGAHTKGQNQRSLGFCFVGNYDILPPKKQAIQMGAKVIALWLKLFGLSVDDIYSHHHFNPHKTCPGTHFSMEFLRTCVRRKL